MQSIRNKLTTLLIATSLVPTVCLAFFVRWGAIDGLEEEGDRSCYQ